MGGTERGHRCRETLEEIERYLDGEADPALRSSIEHHLSGCNPCTQKTEFRQHLKELVQSKCSERGVPDGLWQKVRALIDTPPPAPPAPGGG
jgi:mycothiol system anti-sigma-R factor